MHTHKIVYIKTFKIAPTCFDHAIIIRELRCSSLKSHTTHVVRRNLSDARPTQYEMLPQHQIIIEKSISEYF